MTTSRNRFLLLLLLVSLVALAPSMVSAHGGGLDSNGGHNCYVSPCAGTYHYHVGGSSSDGSDVEPVWKLLGYSSEAEYWEEQIRQNAAREALSDSGWVPESTEPRSSSADSSHALPSPYVASGRSLQEYVEESREVRENLRANQLSEEFFEYDSGRTTSAQEQALGPVVGTDDDSENSYSWVWWIVVLGGLGVVNLVFQIKDFVEERKRK